ncbi:unnamed protein product [Staurois parvus]|uniref:Ig-like domain-containing protein n=1 Tax=Staurois parvus TaxID=386267 RepID=A0ABN9HBC8_9NEOB|nr:unnamed protein product [Staurois parvus]
MSTDAGKTVMLKCNYSTSSNEPYLFWYKQYANQMQYILYRGAKSMSFMRHDGNFKTGKFQSETSESTTILTIYDMTVSDSAVYFCALRDGAQCDIYIVDPSINLLLNTTLPPADGRICYSLFNKTFSLLPHSYQQRAEFSLSLLKRPCHCSKKKIKQAA